MLVEPSTIPGCPTCDLIYNDNCYEHFSEQKSWYDANSSCSDWGGNLASSYDLYFLPIFHNSMNSWTDNYTDDGCVYFTKDGETANTSCNDELTYGCTHSSNYFRYFSIIHVYLVLNSPIFYTALYMYDDICINELCKCSLVIFLTFEQHVFHPLCIIFQ